MNAPAKLDKQALRREQLRTLAAPRRKYGFLARCLFLTMDLVYGKKRTLSKFKVLEVVARVPYQAWESVGYVAVTHKYSEPRFARRIFDRVAESRAEQDNEQWHLLTLEDVLARRGARESFFLYRLVPQILAFAYYHVSWLLYVIRPELSYELNADFEDHAEHEYAALVEENPEWEAERYDGPFIAEYGTFDSLADLLRQIGHDERVHKEASLARIGEARFC